MSRLPATYLVCSHYHLTCVRRCKHRLNLIKVCGIYNEIHTVGFIFPIVPQSEVSVWCIVLALFTLSMGFFICCATFREKQSHIVKTGSNMPPLFQIERGREDKVEVNKVFFKNKNYIDRSYFVFSQGPRGKSHSSNVTAAHPAFSSL